jgi:hypothetical protein
MSTTETDEFDEAYDSILAQLVRMIEHPEWMMRTGRIQVGNAGL